MSARTTIQWWPVYSYLVPALQHDVIQRWGTALGLLHPEPVLHLVQHLQYTHYHPVQCQVKVIFKIIPKNLGQRIKIRFLQDHYGRIKPLRS